MPRPRREPAFAVAARVESVSDERDESNRLLHVAKCRVEGGQELTITSEEPYGEPLGLRVGDVLRVALRRAASGEDAFVGIIGEFA